MRALPAPRRGLACCLVAITLLPVAAARAVEVVDILAFGDSITQAYKRGYNGSCNRFEWGITSWQDGSRQDRYGYEPKLEKLVRETTLVEARVYNWGHGGETTPEGLNRIGGVLDHSGTYVLLLEGANDVLHGISPGTTAFNLGEMVKKSRARGKQAIMATLTPITRACFTSGRNEQVVNEYNPAIRNEAERLSSPWVDQYEAMVEGPKHIWFDKYTSGDGLHLSDAGDQKMAEAWLATLATIDGQFRPGGAAGGLVPVLDLLLEN